MSEVFHSCTHNSLVMANSWCAVVENTRLWCIQRTEGMIVNEGKPN